MGTRGMAGFVIGGAVKATYNHYDSYPSHLGKLIGSMTRKAADDPSYLAMLREKAASLRLVDEEVKPTPEEIERLKVYADRRVAGGNLDDWYVLLRDAQPSSEGDGKVGLEMLLDAGVMIEGASFANDSLFCEYAYLINLDTEVLEVYRGFQNEPHEHGRFAKTQAEVEAAKPAHRSDAYYPIALIRAIPFAETPTDDGWAKLEGE